MKKHKDCILCSSQKLKGTRKEKRLCCKNCINQQLSALRNVSKAVTLSRTWNGFSVGPIVVWVLLFVYIEEYIYDRLCGLVVRVLGYRLRGPGSILGATRFYEK
jgi:hypothetical protein